jgi:simple sugar transport system permease protein
MSELLTAAAIAGVLASTVRLAVPLLLAGLGETLGQRAGVLNLGVDGTMLLGAFGGYYAVLRSGSTLGGLLVGVLVGIAIGLVTALVSVTFRAEQGISGIGVYLVGLGLSELLYQKLVGTPTPIPSFPRIDVPWLSDIPFLGDLLFHHSIAVYSAFALVPLMAWMMRRTTFGLDVRAVGENPAAADSLGVSVSAVRYTAVIIANALGGAAGAALAIELQIFQQNLTNGSGFIVVALVYFGAWRPIGIMAGALLYGFVNALVLQLKSTGVIPLGGSDLAAMAPALITIAALVLVANRFRQPAALTKPFVRDG